MSALDFGVYPILDVGPHLDAPRAPEAAAALLAGGARVLQLRAKALPGGELLALARVIRALTAGRGATFIVNDRPDVAVLAGADGVHLGQDDLPASAVRPWLPPGMILGVSCHDLGQARAAAEAGVANYIGYGPVFATGSKQNPDPVVGLEGLRAVREAHPALPVVAIGGLGREVLPALAGLGGAGAAMIAALLGAEDVEAATRAAVAAFEGAR